MSDSGTSQRKFFMHSAHEAIGVSTRPPTWETCDFPSFAAVENDQRARRVCVICGLPSYRMDEWLVVLKRHLQARHASSSAWVFYRSEDDLHEPANLDRSDCLVLLNRPTRIDDKRLERLKTHWRRGGSVIGIGSAAHRCADWAEFDSGVFGSEILEREHCGDCDKVLATVAVASQAPAHPILDGVVPFVSHGPLPRNVRIAHDANVLLTGAFSGVSSSGEHPVAWTKQDHERKAFCTSLGSQGGLREPNLLRLLSNALHWACAESP